MGEGNCWDGPAAHPVSRSAARLRHAPFDFCLPSEGRQRAARAQQVGITLDLYSHVLPAMLEHAVAKLDAAFQADRRR
jgi:hypothetical protein